MDRKQTLQALAFALAIGLAGCDLEVTNPNDADRGRALASPGDVETLISSSFISGYWESAQYYNGLGPALEVMSNHGSSSWGNFGMNDAGREPREPLMNQSSYSYAYVFEQPWADNYLGISGATDGIRALDGGLEIGAGGADNPRARAFATFVQGLSHCSLALQYDKAFLLDETTDFESGDVAAVPYDQVMDFALQKLDAAISLSQASSFNIPDTWFNGSPMSSAEFVSLIRGYKARCRANLPRDPAERASVDWNAVSTDAAASLGDFILEMEETGPWWSDIKYYIGSEEGTWNRMHYDFAGQGDVSGSYQAWLDIPLQSRTPSSVPLLQIPDKRWPQQNVDGAVGPTTTAIFPRGYYEFVSTIIFRPERGTYRQSNYGLQMYENFIEDQFGPVPEMLQSEMDLLQAEAALEMGNIPAAVSLINKTRVAHGGLPAVVDGGTVPGGASCVPRKRFDPNGTCGDLRDALQWEHYNEIFSLSSGLTFFFTRRQGELPAGTALHSPIPASELEVLQEDIYTFGGDPGAPGSAGQPSLSVAGTGSDLDRVLERVTRTLEVYDRRLKEQEATRAALRAR